ncbi:hypothetical protein [Paractinoplanes brasiliensis]|uniref:hypothetical protein n=1 Tax=Paractinoplanes brasiliensis TaxID=52695 RepID=UPI001A3AF2E0|nr:hypothetical protein [Actinoplanes brasiliensis]GID28122.1 hypothetical protein Abr02nite_31050 [Actinoplanes brasiliensis]
MALVAAVDPFLDRFRDDPATRATCTETLRRLRETAGDQLPVAELTRRSTSRRWPAGPPAPRTPGTKYLSGLTSFTACCGRQGRPATDPGRRLETSARITAENDEHHRRRRS